MKKRLAASINKKEKNDTAVFRSESLGRLATGDENNYRTESNEQSISNLRSSDDFLSGMDEGIDDNLNAFEQHRAKHGYSIHHLGGTLQLEDDMSLPQPSIYAKYHNKDVHIFDMGTESFVLEVGESSNVVTAKHSRDGTFGLYFTRGFYTFFAVLMGFILTSFGMHVILFLFLGIAHSSEKGSINHKDEDQHDKFEISFFVVSSICSLPILIYGLSDTMAIFTGFIQENWNGQQFLKSVVPFEYSYIIDWISTVVYVFVPLFTCALLLCIESSSRWWFYTLLSCQIGAVAHFLIFYLVFIYKDIKFSLRLIQAKKEIDRSRHVDNEQPSHFRKYRIYTLWLCAMQQYLSGIESVKYSSLEHQELLGEEVYNNSSDRSNSATSISITSRVTRLLAKYTPLYREVPSPKRLYHVEEVYPNYVLRNRFTWGLDRFYCANIINKKSWMAFVKGKSALTQAQITSSIICYFIINLLKIIMFISVMIWFQTGTVITTIGTLLFIVFLSKRIFGRLNLVRQIEALEEREDFQIETHLSRNGHEEENMTASIVSRTFQITEPSEIFCISVYIFRLVLFFFLPVVGHFLSGNIPIGILFTVLSITTFCMGYLGSPIALAEIGSPDFPLSPYSSRRQNWRDNHVLRTTASISAGSARKVWTIIFFAFSLVLGVVTSCALIFNVDYRGTGLRFTSEFQYEGHGNLQYPSCQMINGAVDTTSTTLLDYSLLSALSYDTESVRNTTLETWFEGINVVNHIVEVNNFRDEYEKSSTRSNVDYMFIGFPDRGVGVVSIRGTSNFSDLMANFQLFTGAFIAHATRSFIPGGHYLTPLFEFLVKVITKVESNALEKVSYYKETTAFVNHIKHLKYYDEIFITGHSLGGGLAMISGSQSKSFAIAFSSPNMKLSRTSFSPRISQENLNKYSFNVIPDGDIAAMIDDPMKRHERIECRLETNRSFMCHFPTRTFCELNFVCGSNGRPVPCVCAKQLGYPKPTRIMNATDEKYFEEICEDPYL